MAIKGDCPICLKKDIWLSSKDCCPACLREHPELRKRAPYTSTKRNKKVVDLSQWPKSRPDCYLDLQRRSGVFNGIRSSSVST